MKRFIITFGYRISLIFFILMFITVWCSQIFIVGKIPEIVSFLFWLSAGFLGGCYWGMIVIKDLMDKKWFIHSHSNPNVSIFLVSCPLFLKIIKQMFLSIVDILINMVGSWFIIQTQEQPDIVEAWLKPFLFGCGLMVVGSVLFIFKASIWIDFYILKPSPANLTLHFQ